MSVAAIAVLIALSVAAESAEPPGPDWTPALLSVEEAGEGFYPLFNGMDFDGWWIRGINKNAFAAKEGVLSSTGAGGGDWIFSVCKYENFVLRFEYRVFKQDDNSGVAVRATEDGNPAFSGMEVQVLHPEPEPQVGSAGALYGSVKPAVAADNPFGEWNAVEVLCDGSRVRTVMNGRDLYDIDIDSFDSPDKEHLPLKDRARSGHIALQDYGKYVEFRKIRIKPLPGGAGWRTLDLKAPRDNAALSMAPGILRSVEEFDDFELRFSAKASPGGRGAIFLRGHGNESNPKGYEILIDNHDPACFTGSIPGHVAATELRAMDDCWFELRVVAKGANVQVEVNGKTVVDYISPIHKRCPRGWIGLQSGVVEFENIEVKPL